MVLHRALYTNQQVQGQAPLPGPRAAIYDNVRTMFRKIPCIPIGGGQMFLDVAEETPIAIFVNGRHMTTAILSPGGFEDYITGYLYTEGIIRSADEIESIRLEENRISVLTRNLFKRVSAKKTVLSGCGGAVSYIDTEKLPTINSDLTVSVPEIEGAVAVHLALDPFIAAGRIDAAALAGEGGRIVARSEDIDRHNALDRVIGYGLRTSLNFSRTFAISTGRITSEMARKCLVANIPAIITTGAPTVLAVEIAEKTGLCIVGSAGTPDMAVYAHAERIAGIGA
jgi:FdhD protein